MSEREHSNHKKNRIFNKSRSLHKFFNKGGTPVLVKSSKSPQIKNRDLIFVRSVAFPIHVTHYSLLPDFSYLDTAAPTRGFPLSDTK